MSPEQTALYLARFRDRIATIRQSVTVVSLRGKFTNTLRRRDSLGRRGDNARTALSASLGLYHTGVDKSEEDLRDLSPVDWDHEAENEGEGDVDCDGRSDSMEPLRDRDGDSSREDVNDEMWDGQWELDMDREEERLMRSEYRIAEERVSGECGNGEGEMYVAYHSLNSGAARRLRLDEVQRMYEGGGRYATVGKKKGRELQSMLRNMGAEEWDGEGPGEEAQNEEAQNEEVQNEEAQNEEMPNEETPDEEPSHFSADEEDFLSLPSNPYPEDDFLLPLTRQPARTTPPPPFPSPPNLIIHPNSSPGLSIPSPGLSIPSNPYPEDAPSSPTPFSQPPPPPPPPRPTQSPSPYYRAVTPPTPHSRFPIYPSDRAITPISPFNASRHLISAEGTASSLSYRIEHRREGNDGYGYNGNELEGAYAPNHPYHGMDEEGMREYWLGLEGYYTESERNLRRGERRGRRRTVSSPVQYDAERVFGSVGESYEGGGGGDGAREDEVRRRYLNAFSGEERRLAEEEDEEEFAMRTAAGETTAGRKNMMNRLLSTFACRPGTVTPLHTTIPNPNDTNTPTTPKKYTLAYLSHKINRTQKRQEEARLRERLMALRLAEPSAPRTHHIEDINSINNPTEIPVLIPKPKAKRRKDSTQPNPPSLVPNLESRTQSVIGPPVGLSQMIQRAPGSVSVPTPTPLPISAAVSDVEVEGVEGVEESGQRGPRQEHSGSSLSDRLRQTQLEDLPLEQDAAKEIRDLMMALERDQGEVASTPAQYAGGHGLPNSVDTSTTPTECVDELPAGFSRPGTTSSSGHTQPSLSPHETLERHFRTQRQVNERFLRPVRAMTSHSSSRTLPRSYRVPEAHGNGRGILRVTNVVVQGEREEESNELGVDDDEDGNGGGGASSAVQDQQDGTEELAADGEEQKGGSLLRYNGDEEGGSDVPEAG